MGRFYEVRSIMKWKYNWKKKMYWRTFLNLRLFTSQGSQVMENNDSFMGNNRGIVAHCSPLKSVHSEHGLVLQSSESSLFPWQPFPPFAGLYPKIINEIGIEFILLSLLRWIVAFSCAETNSNAACSRTCVPVRPGAPITVARVFNDRTNCFLSFSDCLAKSFYAPLRSKGK